MRLVWGRVDEVLWERDDAQLLTVSAPALESSGRALNYPYLSGRCRIGDRVLLNTTAVDLALGTGGRHFVVARGPEHAAPGGTALDIPSPGHIMKVRYTPLQTDVRVAEEDGLPEYPAGCAADDVAGMPVVCCGLHSQVPVVAAAVKELLDAPVAYVMTDQAALPLALSDTVAACRAAGLLDATVTCGQAFGGDIEAVNLYTGLLAARKSARAAVAIVGIGPGVVGTGSLFGHGGVAQGEAVNATAVVGGTPVVVPRLSFADARERHRGVSHHTVTALTRIATARADVVVPALPPEQAAVIDDAFERAGVWERHDEVDAEPREMPDMRGVPVRSMGRGFAEDPAFFLAAASAGEYAARLAQPPHA